MRRPEREDFEHLGGTGDFWFMAALERYIDWLEEVVNREAEGILDDRPAWMTQHDEANRFGGQ